LEQKLFNQSIVTNDSPASLALCRITSSSFLFIPKIIQQLCRHFTHYDYTNDTGRVGGGGHHWDTGNIGTERTIFFYFSVFNIILSDIRENIKFIRAFPIIPMFQS